MNDREFCNELKRFSDRICNYIFHMDLDWIDVEIQVAEMRDFCELHAPEKMDLFEMIYASRFRRLWETWGRRELECWEWDEAECGY
jgi:hypothetical protein